MTEGQIANALATRIGYRKSLVVPNAVLGFQESDLLHVSRLGYVSEYEIKVSASDLRREFINQSMTKHWKHSRMMTGGAMFSRAYFWLAVPVELGELALSLACESYGILLVNDSGSVTTIRKARRLPGAKPLTFEQLVYVSTVASRRFWSQRITGKAGRA